MGSSIVITSAIISLYLHELWGLWQVGRMCVSHVAFAFILSVFSYRRNFYRTGQDLNNCSTCQNTACIIYRYHSQQ